MIFSGCQDKTFKRIKNEFERDREILYDEELLKSFIFKAIEEKRTEDKFWDFKLMLEYWKPECQVKEKKIYEFCENIAAFANSEGGLIIIGISNEDPRKIFDIKKVEIRANDCGGKIRKFCDYKKLFYEIRILKIEDSDGVSKNCIVIAVKQTSDVVGVKIGTGKVSYQIRVDLQAVPFDK